MSCTILNSLKRADKAKKSINFALKSFRKASSNPNENKAVKDENRLLKYVRRALITASTAIVVGSMYLGARQNNVDIPTLLNYVNTDDTTNLRQQFNFIDKVVKKCAPSVVYIEIKDTNRLDPETGQPITASNGSGFIIRDDGWIVTNAHVVINKPHATINVMMYDGTNYTATVEDADMNIDLALLKIKSNKKLPFLKLGQSVDTTVGEWVVALGSPLSLSHSVTVGVVSSTNREASELGLKNYSMKYIQTDASITFGNSGGPLVNLDGDVIGINNLRITSGISFAIPIDYVKGFLARSRFLSNSVNNEETKNDRRLGITTFKVTPNLIRELTDEFIDVPHTVNHGVLVWKVINGAPAQMSGLEPGDIITHIDGVPVRETSDVYLLLGNKKHDTIQTVVIFRKGKTKEVFFKTIM